MNQNSESMDIDVDDDTTNTGIYTFFNKYNKIYHKNYTANKISAQDSQRIQNEERRKANLINPNILYPKPLPMRRARMSMSSKSLPMRTARMSLVSSKSVTTTTKPKTKKDNDINANGISTNSIIHKTI